MSVIGIACAVMLATMAFGGERSDSSKSRESTSTLQLPPRGHATDGASTNSRSGNSATSLWTTALSLAAIVGCLALVGYWLKPALGIPGQLPLEALELLGRRAIEQKVTIHLIRCGGKVLVVSVSPDGARTLSEVTDPAEVQKVIAACHAPRQTRALIPGTGALMGRWAAPGESADPGPATRPPPEGSRHA